MNSENKEKRTYTPPAMEEIDADCQQFLCCSNGDQDCIDAEIEGTP